MYMYVFYTWLTKTIDSKKVLAPCTYGMLIMQFMCMLFPCTYVMTTYHIFPNTMSLSGSMLPRAGIVFWPWLSLSGSGIGPFSELPSSSAASLHFAGVLGSATCGMSNCLSVFSTVLEDWLTRWHNGLLYILNQRRSQRARRWPKR